MQRRFIIIVRTNGVTDRLRILPVTEMLFERTYKTGFTGAAFEGPEAATNLYRLAWEVDRIQGGVVAPLSEWVKDIEACDVVTEEILPTKPGVPAGGSPPSPSPPESPPES